MSIEQALSSTTEQPPRVVCRTTYWSVEHEPESDTYLLIDWADAYCADLYWSASGECWADFAPYVAFSGPTTIADIDRLHALAHLLAGLPCPQGRTTKEPLRRR
jgi:hypothetical protein